MYSTTGTLLNTCGCMKEKQWFNAIRKQHGGSEMRGSAPLPSVSVSTLSYSSPQHLTKDEDPVKCVKFNANRQYRNVSTESHGFYPDLTADAIGNRPVIGFHNNSDIVPNVLLKTKGNLLNRKLDCTQPFWCSKCI